MSGMSRMYHFRYTENETLYDDFDRRRLECLLIEHHHQAEELAKRVCREADTVEASEWLVISDECEYFSYQVTIALLQYEALRDQLRLVVQQKNQLVREGFWLSRANVAYQEQIRFLDRRLSDVRRAIRPLGIVVNV